MESETFVCSNSHKLEYFWHFGVRMVCTLRRTEEGRCGVWTGQELKVMLNFDHLSVGSEIASQINLYSQKLVCKRFHLVIIQNERKKERKESNSNTFHCPSICTTSFVFTGAYGNGRFHSEQCACFVHKIQIQIKMNICSVVCSAWFGLVWFVISYHVL